MYNSVLRGFLNYYSFVHNYGPLVSRLQFELKASCAKLLAAKFTLKTKAGAYNKFGPNLACKHVDSKGNERLFEFLKPSYKITLRFLTNASPIISSLYGSLSLASLDNLECVICGSKHRVEMHHVRHLKDLNPKLNQLDKLMASRQRKQIPVCRSCHMLHHRHGLSLSKSGG
jgi:hypothetical protein